MPRRPEKRQSQQATSSPAGEGGNSPAANMPSISQLEYDEMMVTFEDGDVDYNKQDHAESSYAGGSSVVRTKKSIKSNTSINLTGPMEIDGSVKTMGSLSFLGDFSVRGKIEAYRNIGVNGSVTCSDKIKSFGNLDIYGYVYCGSKVKIFGQLTVNGNFEVQDSIEVWGAVVIQGYLKCRNLTAYSSVTTVGNSSGYEVSESETVWGAKMVRYTEDEV